MIVGVKFMNAGAPRMMLMDSGSPNSEVGEWKWNTEEKLLYMFQNGRDNIFGWNGDQIPTSVENW